ncbi:MAG: DNA-binding protein [Rhodospirillales bacterium]|nr:DNA-binding protein [Rhodospirillales bacterium]
MNNSFSTPEIRPINWRVNDFCQAHGICRTSFYEEVKRGELKIIKYGSRTLVPDSEAKAWQERRLLGGSA